MNNVRQLIKKRLSGIWVKRCHVFVSLAILFVSIAGYSSTCFSGIVYFDGFENGFKSWNTGLYKSTDHCCDHSLTLGTTGDGFPVNSGTYSFRSLVLAGDPGVKGHTARAELTGDKAVTETGAPLDVFNKDRWYGFSVYVPDRGVRHDYKGMGKIWQWHSNIYTGGGIGVDLCIQGIDGIPQWTAEGHNPLGNWIRYFKTPAADDLGKWTHFVFQVRWVKNTSEYSKIKLWKNGTLIWSADPWVDNEPETGDNPRYIKLGVDYPGTVDDYPLIFYYDNFAVGDENSSLAEMQAAMGGGGGGDPDPDPDPEDEDEILEAESAIVSGITKVNDSDASNGYYVVTQSWGTGELSFQVDVADAGLYKVVGRVFAYDERENSYFFHIDDQEEDIWDFVGSFNQWQSLDMSKRGTGSPDNPQENPYTIQLSAGSHTISFRGRETGSRLDYIVLERLDKSALSPPDSFKIVQ